MDRINQQEKKEVDEKVTQIQTLPECFTEARLQVFYVVTDKNVYCVQKRKNLFNMGHSFGATGEMARSHDRSI